MSSYTKSMFFYLKVVLSQKGGILRKNLEKTACKKPLLSTKNYLTKNIVYKKLYILVVKYAFHKCSKCTLDLMIITKFIVYNFLKQFNIALYKFLTILYTTYLSIAPRSGQRILGSASHYRMWLKRSLNLFNGLQVED